MARFNSSTVKQTILLFLLFFQWALFALILIERHHKNKNGDENEISFTTSKLVSSSDDRPQRLHYAGVSATLLLNAPQWFQRRYTAMISNVLMNTPRDWAVQIFYFPEGQSQIGLDINPGIVRLSQIYRDRLLLTPIPNELVKKFGTGRKLKYWGDAWIWKTMVADRVFVFGGNGAMCANSRRLNFLDASDSVSSSAMQFLNQLDWVGTPWWGLNGRGGDGGFSYRNRTAMLMAIQFNPHDGTTDESSYFIKTMLHMNEKIGTSFRIASREQSVYFGGTTYKSSNGSDVAGPPMVISGTLSDLDTVTRELMLAWCPEIKLIFPALHDPNCFGAEPNTEKCAKSICALKDPKDRPGGC